MRPEQLRASLDLMILASLQRERLHGYALTERLRHLSDGQIDIATGTIYPALHRLEHGKLIKSSDSEVDGRRRRVYALTPRGRTRLNQEVASWQAMQHVVTSVLDANG